MSTLLLLTSTTQPSADVLPALALLPHHVKILPAEGSALLDAPDVDLESVIESLQNLEKNGTIEIQKITPKPETKRGKKK